MGQTFSNDEIKEYFKQSHSKPEFSQLDYESTIKRRLVETRNERAFNKFDHLAMAIGGSIDRFDQYFYGKIIYLDIEYNQGLPIPRQS